MMLIRPSKYEFLIDLLTELMNCPVQFFEELGLQTNSDRPLVRREIHHDEEQLGAYEDKTQRESNQDAEA